MEIDNTASAVSVPADVRAFFEAYSAAGDHDPAAAAELFCEQFLSLDPSSARTVTRAELAATLPLRARMFASIGSQGTDLVELSAHPVDAQHTLARTAWRVRLENPDADPLVLHSSFLLHLENGDWRIAAYINHADLGAIIRERQQSDAARS